MKPVRPHRSLLHLALGIVLSTILSGCAASDSAPRAADGRIDLSSWDFSRGDVDLVGDWSVCWGQLLEPGEACPTEWRPVHVRGLWSDDSARSPFGGKGVATYRLEVALPVGERSLSLSAGAPMSAYRLWIDGVSQPGSGVVGRTAETTSTVPRRNLVFSLPQTAEPVELHVQLANFEFRGGGIRRSWLVGRPESIAAYRGRGLLREAMLLAVGGAVGLLYLAQFALRPQEVDRGYFGFFALVVACRSIPASISDLSQLLFPWASLAGLMRLEYLGEALVMVAGAGYFQAKVRGVMPPRTIHGIQMFSLALGLFVAVAPFPWVLETLPFFLVLPPAILALVIACYGSAWWRGVEGVRITLVASLVFSLGVIHDVIRTSVTDFGLDLELFPYLIVVWLMAEAFGQAQIFARTFARVENLSDELAEANFELQETESAIARFVPFDLLGLLGKSTIRDVAPGEHVRVEMSVVHCDLGGFDEVASHASSEEAVRYLRTVVETLTPAIQHNGGFVTEHRGEGLQALFPGGVDDAVRASIAMLAAARERGEALELGIGIETGPLLLGTAGEGEQLLGSVMGSAVIGAERLASRTRKSEARLLLSEATRAAWPDASGHTLEAFSANGESGVWEVVEARDA